MIGTLFLPGKLLHCRHELLADRIHQRTGGELVAAMKPEEAGHSAVPLQGWHVNVQVHPVDSFDFQGDVIVQHFGDRSWYAHFRLRYDSGPSGSTAASAA